MSGPPADRPGTGFRGKTIREPSQEPSAELVSLLAGIFGPRPEVASVWLVSERHTFPPDAAGEVVPALQLVLCEPPLEAPSPTDRCVELCAEVLEECRGSRRSQRAASACSGVRRHDVG